MTEGTEESLASFEARSAAWSHPTERLGVKFPVPDAAKGTSLRRVAPGFAAGAFEALRSFYGAQTLTVWPFHS